jgi:uncharacterized membrane protein YhdT
VQGYLGRVRDRYAKLLDWFDRLSPVERTVAWMVILFGTLALSVTSLGLWLVLFSVQLPLWFVAAGSAFVRMVWTSLQKTVFKAIAFLQLGWKGLRRLLPSALLERKRRLDFRIARAVVRRRRLTLKQLVERKGRLPFRLGLMAEYLFHPPGRPRK